MAEPSTDYIPPRLEAPYATFAPIQLPAGENIPQASIFVANAYGIPMDQSPYLDRIPAVPAVPGADANANDLDTALIPPPQPYNNLYDGPIPKYQSVLPLDNANGNQPAFGNYPNTPNYPNVNNYPNGNYPIGNFPNGNYPNGNYPSGNYPNVNYPSANSVNSVNSANTNVPSSSFPSSNHPSSNFPSSSSPSSNYPSSNFPSSNYPSSNYPSSNYPTSLGTSSANQAANQFAPQSATSFYRPQYAGLSHGYPSTASLASSQPLTSAYSSSAALASKQPAYITSSKSLSHFASSLPLSKIYTMQKAVKNSRPMAVTPSHLQRKPQPSFGSDAASQGSFRPSFLLGSQYVASTADYKQPSHTSLGTANQFFASPQSAPSNQYVTRDIGSFIPPGTSYGVPETPFYIRESMKSSIFGMPYGRPQSV